jgi:hypothetical protein
MIEVEFAGKDYQIPENWTEVPESDRLQLLGLVFAQVESGGVYHEILRIVFGFTTQKWAKLMQQYFSKRSTEERIEQNAAVLQELLHLVKWMWDRESVVRPFEYVMLKGNKELLFEEGFKSMTFGELTDAYIHAHSYIQQLEEGDKRLNMLIATLCRRERQDFSSSIEQTIDGWNGDVRIPYNAYFVGKIYEEYDVLPVATKILVLVYFLSQLKDFLSYYDIYDDDGRPMAEEYPGQGYIKNQHLLAEKGIFGNMEKTKAANVHEVFLFLEENKADIKEQMRQQKAMEDADSN